MQCKHRLDEEIPDNFLFVKATSESSAKSFTQILFRISPEEGRTGRESSNYIENGLSSKFDENIYLKCNSIGCW